MTRVRVALVLVLLGAVSGRLAAQADAAPDDWRVTFTPYIWVSSLKGTVGVDGNLRDVDVSFGDRFDGMDLGFVGLLEVRRYPWVLRTDVFYQSLSDEQTAAGGQLLTVGQDEFMVHPEAGYTLLARPWGGVDGLVGVRYWNLSLDLTLPPEEASGDRHWLDGTVGVNVRYLPARKWRLFAKSDVGTGGSNLTWELYGGGAYDLGSCCSVVAGYRHLDVDYDEDEVVYDVRLSGPGLGVTLWF